MDYNIWLKRDMVIYLGGDPSKGAPPDATITKVKNPQIIVDSEKGTIVILETK